MSTFGVHHTTFIVSSQHPPSDGFFQGYCFHQTDLIFGAAGAEQFEATTGKAIASGLDGCYVRIRRTNDAYAFDIDFAGYKILYYYHDGNTWAVSNSLARMVDFLRKTNIAISPNYTHLAAIGGRGMAASQLFSLETTVRNVRVAPRTHTLVMTPTQAILEPRLRLSQRPGRYIKELSNLLNTWVSRFETLLVSDQADFTSALTGGVDSRAIFAMVSAASHRLGNSVLQPHLHSHTEPENQKDLAIAKLVANTFDMTVNDERSFHRLSLTSQERYCMYRDFSLGVYFPLYIPQYGPTLGNISVGGGGGGVHRKTYELHIKSKDYKRFIKRYSQYFKRPEYSAEFIRDGHAFLNTALQKNEDPLRVLLRDGRVRYHAGREARTGVAFTPLHSAAADRTQLAAGPVRVEDGQLNYDIMHSLQPELVDLPFDTDNKAPTTEIRNRLMAAPVLPDPNPGRVWSGSSRTVSTLHDLPADSPTLQEAFRKAIENPFVADFWPKEMLGKARNLMETIDAGNSFGNAANGKPISAVLTADLVAPN